jgi:heat shock protein HspQ
MNWNGFWNDLVAWILTALLTTGIVVAQLRIERRLFRKRRQQQLELDAIYKLLEGMGESKKDQTKLISAKANIAVVCKNDSINNVVTYLKSQDNIVDLNNQAEAKPSMNKLIDHIIFLRKELGISNENNRDDIDYLLFAGKAKN